LLLVPAANGKALATQAGRDSLPCPDLELLAEWLTGEFNNFAQHEEDVYSREKLGKEIPPHVHIHCIFAPITIPGVNGRVFHVQQSDGQDLQKVFRQRLYIFTWNALQQVVELRIYKYPDDGVCINLHKQPDRW